MSCHANNEKIKEECINPASPYFPPTPYTGPSIVDGLRAINAQTSYTYRASIAAINGMGNYTGRPQENLHMLNLLKIGKLLRP